MDHLHILQPNNIIITKNGINIELLVDSCIFKGCGYWNWILEDENEDIEMEDYDNINDFEYEYDYDYDEEVAMITNRIERNKITF